MSDPLNRGPLTRWLPVLLQAKVTPPEPLPYEPCRRFLLTVLSSAKRYTIPGAIAAMVEMIGLALMMPLVIGRAVDLAIGPSDTTMLYVFIAVIATAGAVRITAARLSQQLGEYASQTVQHRLRATLSRSVLHTPGNADGRIVSVMTNDVRRLGSSSLVVQPLNQLAAIIAVAICFMWINWVLGVLVMVGAPLVVWLLGRLSRRYAQANRTYQSRLSATVARAGDLVAGYRVIRGLNAETEATRRYRDSSQDTLDGADRTAGAMAYLQSLTGTISGGFTVLVAVTAGWFAIEGAITVGEFITAIGLIQALLNQLRGLTSTAIPAIAAASASADRVRKVVEGMRMGTSGSEIFMFETANCLASAPKTRRGCSHPLATRLRSHRSTQRCSPEQFAPTWKFPGRPRSRAAQGSSPPPAPT